MLYEAVSGMDVGSKESNDSDVNIGESKKGVTINDGRYLPFSMHPLITVIITHIGAVYGVYLMFTSADWKTSMFAFLLYRINILGISGGVHRLWTHRGYKAKLPVRIFLMLAFTSAYHLSIRHWVRDHRVHHLYTETDADPHNSNRGLFYSHMGWVIRQRHPENLKKLRECDLSDIMADPVVRFNEKYWFFLVFWVTLFFPTAIPMYFWNETFVNSLFICVMFRFVIVLHETFCVNSIAHAWGYRPYNSNIKPVEILFLQLIGTGEGFHNYHHVFPFDYALSDFGIKGNTTKAFIDILSWFGLTYDLKTAPKSVVEARVKRNQMETLAKNSEQIE